MSFYIISYLLKYSLTLSTIRQNSMGYSQECLVLGTLEALNYPRLELNEKNLHGLHHGQTINEKSYIYKMSIQMMDFGVILLMYFGHWNMCNTQFMYGIKIMSKVGNEYNSEILHINYGNNHFVLIVMHNEITNVVNV